jgi:hypothetical protein
LGAKNEKKKNHNVNFDSDDEEIEMRENPQDKVKRNI